jgi:hypothetical protein
VPCQLRIAFEAVDRPDLREELCGGERGAAGQLEQRRRDLDRPLRELLVEFRDRAVERADRCDELAGESHLQLLLSACQPARDPLQLGGAVESAQRS